MGSTLAWATDIHLDHAGPEASLSFFERVRASGATALLLGGDTATAPDIDDILVEMVETVDIPVYFVLGNHDYYRGSIADVHRRIARLDDPRLHWLPHSVPHELAPGITLVGQGGWGDARIGDFAGSDVVLSDYIVIEELRRIFSPHRFAGTFGTGTALEAELRKLGREAADELVPALNAAAATSRQVVVLTHVPPFREACWHEGRISSEIWLPGFTCGAVGEVLMATASAHPDCRFTVLCGHTHSGGRAQVARNLVVHTQAAEYGAPDFVLIEIDEGRIVVGA